MILGGKTNISFMGFMDWLSMYTTGKKKVMAISSRNSPRITFPQKLLFDFFTKGVKSFDFFLFL